MVGKKRALILKKKKKKKNGECMWFFPQANGRYFIQHHQPQVDTNNEKPKSKQNHTSVVSIPFFRHQTKIQKLGNRHGAKTVFFPTVLLRYLLICILKLQITVRSFRKINLNICIFYRSRIFKSISRLPVPIDTIKFRQANELQFLVYSLIF